MHFSDSIALNRVEIRIKVYVKTRSQKCNLLIDNMLKLFFRDYFIL